jgi:hypothetical protein
MLIVTSNVPTQAAYIAREVFLEGTRTPHFDQFENARFLSVMDNENHTVRSRGKKVHGNSGAPGTRLRVAIKGLVESRDLSYLETVLVMSWVSIMRSSLPFSPFNRVGAGGTPLLVIV